MFFLLLFFISLLTVMPIHCASTPSPYITELTEYFTQKAVQGQEYIPHTAEEKLFHTIFSVATLPYSQPIRQLLPTDFPHLYKLSHSLSTRYQISEPLLFMACDTSTGHIDIKLCTLNQSSALLLHPNTLVALSERVFERYVEQAFMRIQSTIAAHKKHQYTKRKNAMLLGVCGGSTLAILTAALGYYWSQASTKPAWATFGGAGAIMTTASVYGALLYHYLSKKHAGFSFQRISSFHNSEQAREDYFPPLDANQQPTFTSNPGPLFGLESLVKTEEYLRARNTHFQQLEQLDTEKKEDPSIEGSKKQSKSAASKLLHATTTTKK